MDARPSSKRICAERFQFDVAVTASKESGSSASIKVFAGLFGGGVDGRSTDGLEHASRIRFAVPIQLPVSPRKPSA